MRRFYPFLVLFLAFVSSGCRMCGSPYDYCMPTYLDRQDDYRGCDSLYRSGSIYQTVGCRSGCSGDVALADRSINAGNFGVTTSIDSSGPTQRSTGTTIGKPPADSLFHDNGFETIGVEELLQDNAPGRPTPLTPAPLTPKPTENNRPTPPPAQPQPVQPPQVEPPVETMPFTMPKVHEPTITVEDLRRLDPSVTDIKIINIDDAVDTTAPKGNPIR